MKQPSIFSQVVNGDLPSHKVYEDERTYAFLNIYPSVDGHVLVVPKVEVDHLDDLDDVDYQAVMSTVQKVMKQLRTVLGVERACLKVQGFDVPHAHVHVLPCDTPADFFKNEDMDTDPDHEALAAMTERLRF